MFLLSPFRKLVFCGGVVMAGVTIASAASSLSPQGSEYPIIGNLLGDQVAPAAAVNSLGGLVVWRDNSISSVGSRISAARLGPELSLVGSPFPVSRAITSKATGDQEKPKAALLPDGGAVIIWQQGGMGKAPAQQIYARFLKADGTFSKSDIRVGAHPKNNQSDPAVAVLSDGTVMVTWSSFGQDGNMNDVFAQLFSSQGTKLGGEVRLNEFTSFNQHQSDVTALADGTFLVSWISEFQSNPQGSVDVIARRFSSTGSALSREFYVTPTTSNACANPSVVGFASGGFAVGWSQKADIINFSPSVGTNITSQELTSKSWDVYGRFFDASGIPVAGPIRLNSTIYGDQYAPRLAGCGEGCLAVWTSLGQDGSREGVYGQLFQINGDLEGSEFRVNETTISRQLQPVVVSDSLNRYLVIWASVIGTSTSSVAGSSFDLFAQKYLQSSGF